MVDFKQMSKVADSIRDAQIAHINEVKEHNLPLLDQLDELFDKMEAAGRVETGDIEKATKILDAMDHI